MFADLIQCRLNRSGIIRNHVTDGTGDNVGLNVDPVAARFPIQCGKLLRQERDYRKQPKNERHLRRLQYSRLIGTIHFIFPT